MPKRSSQCGARGIGEVGCLTQKTRTYLRKFYNLSSEDYRKKWGLPEGFQMVAPKYSKRRGELAKKSGKRPKTRMQAVS